MRSMRILITNDDGISSPGLRAVVEAVRRDFECLVVAPSRERSAIGHSVTLYNPIEVETIDLGKNLKGYSVEGTPADCVKFAVVELSKDKSPDLVISGINLGINSGISVYYSGTVSAAREGLINGIPAIAISQAKEQTKEFSYSVKLICALANAYREQVFPKDTFLNINVPALPSARIKGIRLAKQAHSRFIERFEPCGDSSLNKHKSYLLSSELNLLDPDGTTDEEVLRQGFVSVTPLQLDTTRYGQLAELEAWFNNLGAENRENRDGGRLMS